ncbi:sugar phosphate isomerase/epimerase family protein [Streptomyces sp. SBT349]|uniref:sugar phosphate isomerase/epimerase family protein n=1 Tax=Streptomyces sp. SBT349 TaxID=1580539 RepID=UPI00066BD996|nr:TIM barrel protein [Streptomyces sp. SBT349]
MTGQAPATAGERLGFATLGCPGAPLSEVIGLARRHGCGAVELRAAEGEILHTGMPAGQAERVGRELASAGLTALAVNSYVRLCAPATPGAGPDDQLDALLAHVDLAARAGARAVRVFMNDDAPAPGAPGAGPTEGERRAVDRVARAATSAARAGVAVLVETHDSHARAGRVAAFLALLDAEVPGHGCGAVWDTAHTWAHGERPADSLALLRPWLGYVQIKDIRSPADPVPVPLGTGAYPVGELAAALDAAGWEGMISLEWERMWHPELPSLDEALGAARVWAEPLLRPRRSP